MSLQMFIHYNVRKADDAIEETLASEVIPQLRTILETAAQHIIEQPGFENSPYAKEFAAELMIQKLVGFLGLSDFEDTETARLTMFAPNYVNWWFQLEDEK